MSDTPRPIIPHPDDSWARVELYRWQYGTLPDNTESLPLNEADGVLTMTAALEDGYKSGDMSGAPSLTLVCLILKYLVRRIT